MRTILRIVILIAAISIGLVIGMREQVSRFRQAVATGDIDTVTRLSSHVNINARDKEGMTALNIAIYHNHANVVAFLLSHGADVNTHEVVLGKTPLIIAVIHYNYCYSVNDRDDSYAIIKMLLDYHADTEASDIFRRTPLYAASDGGAIPVIELLLNYHANVNACSYDGSTALHDAVDHENITVVRLLLKHGADKTIRDSYHMTALDCAKKMGNSDLVEALSK